MGRIQGSGRLYPLLLPARGVLKLQFSKSSELFGLLQNKLNLLRSESKNQSRHFGRLKPLNISVQNYEHTNAAV